MDAFSFISLLLAVFAINIAPSQPPSLPCPLLYFLLSASSIRWHNHLAPVDFKPKPTSLKSPANTSRRLATHYSLLVTPRLLSACLSHTPPKPAGHFANIGSAAAIGCTSFLFTRCLLLILLISSLRFIAFAFVFLTQHPLYSYPPSSFFVTTLPPPTILRLIA